MSSPIHYESHFFIIAKHYRTSFLKYLERYYIISSYAFAKFLQLEEAEKRLQDSESMLARFRGPRHTSPSRSSQDCGFKCVKDEPRSASPVPANGGCCIICLVN